MASIDVKNKKGTSDKTPSGYASWLDFGKEKKHEGYKMRGYELSW